MTEREIVRVKSAPGLHWKKREGGVFEARWQCRDDLVKRDNFQKFGIKSVKLWKGTIDPTLEEWGYISDTCTQLQQEMLVWANGGLPTAVTFDGTLAGLILCYRSDPDSPYLRPGKLRYASKVHYDVMMGLLGREIGAKAISEIKGRTVQRWYDDWAVYKTETVELSSEPRRGKKQTGGISAAHTRVKIFRLLINFGASFLEDDECIRLATVLSKMRFANAKSRIEQLTAEQATLVRHKAREMGRPSISVAQAFQFECMFRQKDCIGEWVPLTEPGMTDVIHEELKWLRGIRWEEIDQNLRLTHTTSKRSKELPISLRNAPMVMEELALIAGVSPAKVTRDLLPSTGPIVIREMDNLPWPTPEFRRWWRQVADACDIPKEVKNMDSRAGAISEAEDAEAAEDDIRENATHSNVSMTRRYMRGRKEKKIARVQQLRVESRNKPKTE